MKLAFYKYEFGNWKDWLIAKVTKSKYSHVELILDTGVSLSSSPRDSGVRYKNIDYKNDRWDIFTIKNRKINCFKYLGYGYDWGAIFLHWIGLKSYKKFVCSDLIYFLLTQEIDFKTPNDLYNLTLQGAFN